MSLNFNNCISFNPNDSNVVKSNDYIIQINELLKPYHSASSRILVYAKKSPQVALIILSAFTLNIPYIPVDSANPYERVNQIIYNCKPNIVLLDKESAFYKILQSKNIAKIIFENENLVLLNIEIHDYFQHPPHLAAVLFTSGSTGVPKGVMISRANIVTFVNWMIDEYAIKNETRILSVAPFNFDLSLFDLFATFIKKATLFFTPDANIVNPLAFAKFIFDNKINTIYATPTWFTLLVAYGKLNNYDFSFVQNLLVAGEPFKVDLANNLHTYFPNAKIANLYGPTETNVCTFYNLDFTNSLFQNNGVLSIGKTCPYVKLNINEDGVLCVMGKTTMLGYWPNVLKNELYCTGDNVTFDANNDVYHFVGRADGMIKRNGYRIEKAEIEAVLMKFNTIDNVALTFRENKLTAHLLSQNNALSIVNLREHCMLHLPHFMIPDDFKIHNFFPLTSSGKIDYKKLELNK